ncbi:hypothetical protein [Xenorhabdus poinarii]|uniref:hypothetical protein n=1 Tax=Xenorhabdus poinarii TaxID=40577 RepID=UPI0012FF3382|nr:hypothetical protein [Xenorhabdus poinarii]
MNARADALTIMPLFTENSRSLKGSACLRYICPPLKADIVSPVAVKVFLFFISTSNVVIWRPAGKIIPVREADFLRHRLFLPTWRTSHV